MRLSEKYSNWANGTWVTGRAKTEGDYFFKTVDLNILRIIYKYVIKQRYFRKIKIGPCTVVNYHQYKSVFFAFTCKRTLRLLGDASIQSILFVYIPHWVRRDFVHKLLFPKKKRPRPNVIMPPSPLPELAKNATRKSCYCLHRMCRKKGLKPPRHLPPCKIKSHQKRKVNWSRRCGGKLKVHNAVWPN